MSRLNVDDCYEEQWEPDNAGLPDEENMNLPFLTYGFFKPHQIAYSQIKKYVDRRKIQKVKVYYKLKNVNGMPVLLNESTDYPAQAYIITFENHGREDAYEHIGKTKNMHVYSWNVITVETEKGENEKVNVLMYPEDEDFPEKSYEFPGNNYDWRDDPVFEATFDYLDWQITKLKNFTFEYKWDDLRPLMGIQSLYMTLWSAIDRFLTFRYGKTQSWNVQELSLEPSFKKSLEDNYDSIGIKSFYENRERNDDENDYIIFSTKDLKNYCLNPLWSTCSAKYYYNLRNNVVHSSKVDPKEVDIVWNALIGLKKIFHDVYEEVKKE